MDFGAIAGAIGGDMASSAMSMHEARRNRRWQEKMSSTAHQREVKDLIAAGLNPILSAGGKGAGIGPGAQGKIAEMGKTFSSAQQVNIAKKQMDANVRNTEAQAAQNEVTATLESQALQYLKKHPEYYDTVMSSMLARRSGLLNVVGALQGFKSGIEQKGSNMLINWLDAYNDWSSKRVRDKQTQDVRSKIKAYREDNRQPQEYQGFNE